MNVYVNVEYRCGPPTSPATMRFTAVCETPSPWYMSSGIGTSAALRMRNARSHREDRSHTASVATADDVNRGRLRRNADACIQNLDS
jgi:hypothetical protein